MLTGIRSRWIRCCFALRRGLSIYLSKEEHMSFKNLLLETTDGVAKLTVNRPESLNALNSEVLGELEAAFSQLDADAAVKVVVLTGSGEKAFVAGADIKEMATMSSI